MYVYVDKILPLHKKLNLGVFKYHLNSVHKVF